MRKAFYVILALLICSPLMAQTGAPQEIVQSEKTPSPNSLSGFASDFLNDQKDIWTSPLHMSRGDVEWLAPIGAGAAALFAFDHQISNAIKPDTGLRTPSNIISDVGLVAVRGSWRDVVYWLCCYA